MNHPVIVRLFVVLPAVFESVSKFWVEAAPRVVRLTHCAPRRGVRVRTARAATARASVARRGESRIGTPKSSWKPDEAEPAESNPNPAGMGWPGRDGARLPNPWR